MNIDNNTQVWVVGAVLGAIMGTLGFLVRNAFTDVKTMLADLTIKFDKLVVTQAEERGERRVLESQLQNLQREVAELRATVRDLSEGVAR